MRPNDTTTYYDEIDSPVGRLRLVADAGGLCGMYFEVESHPTAIEPDWIRAGKPLERVHRQLDEYFAGKRQAFDLALNPHGTPFQLAVWMQLRRIPYATTINYGELARRVGNPAASRAVGAANGRNPLSIIVPCHRVIGANGTLTGYGGGLPIKQFLLELERRTVHGDLFAA
ncbi:MAG: methylated-DNA--[protein]-cysteine S-methyltransferase [Xanthomonadales bacterium]|nr:methylated-DNA--[protein]-cysteine S-methyltransferase [Xanthomonadales bacterium]